MQQFKLNAWKDKPCLTMLYFLLNNIKFVFPESCKETHYQIVSIHSDTEDTQYNSYFTILLQMYSLWVSIMIDLWKPLFPLLYTVFNILG